MWMKHDPNKENEMLNGRSNETGLLRCPMCKGRGYFEPSQFPPSKISETDIPSNNILKLPSLDAKPNSQILPKPKNKYCLPSIKSVKHDKRSNELTGCNDNFTVRKTKVKQTNFVEVESVVPHRAESKLKTRKSQEVISVVSSNESTCEKSLIPSPKTPQNPSESLKISLSRLKTNNWNEAVSSLKAIVQLSRFYPRLLDPNMVVVYRGLIALLRSFRSVVVRTACQAANELFATMSNTQRPEFDELVNLLLLKTGDTNKAVRQDANEALDTMILSIPFTHSVRTITQKGITHKNPLVRGASARLLVCVVGVTGVDAVYAASKETRGRIITAAATFMQDGCQEVRNFGRRLMKMLMEHDDFEDVLQAEVNEVLLRRIEKNIITMKYKT